METSGEEGKPTVEEWLPELSGNGSGPMAGSGSLPVVQEQANGEAFWDE